jgi:hypothetical protein
MSFTDKHIVETYSRLFEGLSDDNKLGLIENLSKSLKKTAKDKDKAFFKSFGAFGSDKTASVIAKEIKASRKFKKKEITL